MYICFLYLLLNIRSLSVLEEAGPLLLVDGGLRPGAALWIPDGTPVKCGLGKPEVGCFNPNISTGGKECKGCAHTHLTFREQ